jgi:hypothetical protein
MSVTSAAPLRYESAFAGYRPMDDAGPGDWKGLNDRLRESVERRAQSTGHGSMPPQMPAPGAGQAGHAEHGAKK